MKTLLRLFLAAAFFATAQAGNQAFTGAITPQYPQQITLTLYVNNANVVTGALLVANYVQDMLNSTAGVKTTSIPVGSPQPGAASPLTVGTPTMQIDYPSTGATTVSAAGATVTRTQLIALILQDATNARVQNP